MTFTFIGKKVEVTDELRNYAEKKIGKIDRLFRTESDANVTFRTERGRCTAEVTLRNNGMIYRVSEVTSDMFASIDSAVAAIERQVRRNKTRLARRLRSGGLELQPADLVEEDDTEDAPEVIIRTKTFSFKPMSPEEAILQMNLLGHQFFVFNDDQTNKTCVVYVRKDGDYGLIIPE